jgi:hypothetical protein
VPADSCGSVVCGMATDLSSVSISEAENIIAADELSASYGVGLYYGQLVVLGCKEYHVSNNASNGSAPSGGWQPVGIANETFVLKRKTVANGLEMLPVERTSNQTCGHRDTPVDGMMCMERAGESCGSITHAISVTSAMGRLQPRSFVAEDVVVDGNTGNYLADHPNTLNPGVSPWLEHDTSIDGVVGVIAAGVGTLARNTGVSDVPSPSVDSPFQSSLIIQYISDPTRDIFQIGRSEDDNCNDFICKGPIHDDVNGIPCGTVSRIACRIVCDRLPPYRSWLFASGFSSTKVS